MLRPLRQPEAIVRRQRVIDLLIQVRTRGRVHARTIQSHSPLHLTLTAPTPLTTQSEASEAIANLRRFLPKIANIGRALLRLRRSAGTYKVRVGIF